MKPSRTIQMNPENISQTHKTTYCADSISMKWLEQAEIERRLVMTKSGVGWGKVFSSGSDESVLE